MAEIEPTADEERSDDKVPLTETDLKEHTPEAITGEEIAHEAHTDEEANLPPVEQLQAVQLAWEGKRAEYLQDQPEAQKQRRDVLEKGIQNAREFVAGTGNAVNLPTELTRAYNDQVGTNEAQQEANRQQHEALSTAAETAYKSDLQKAQRRSRLTLGLGGGNLRRKAEATYENSKAQIDFAQQEQNQGMYAQKTKAESMVNDHISAQELSLRAEIAAQERARDQAPERAAAVERADHAYENSLDAINADEQTQLDDIRKLGPQNGEGTDSYYDRINKVKDAAEAKRQQALLERMSGPYAETIQMRQDNLSSIHPADTLSKIIDDKVDQTQPQEDRRAA
jgi:hypothetical protein